MTESESRIAEFFEQLDCGSAQRQADCCLIRRRLLERLRVSPETHCRNTGSHPRSYRVQIQVGRFLFRDMPLKTPAGTQKMSNITTDLNTYKRSRANSLFG
eukprot:scaffold235423_cov22-Prasinocladus_malaysianus.AAC.1